MKLKIRPLGVAFSVVKTTTRSSFLSTKFLSSSKEKKKKKTSNDFREIEFFESVSNSAYEDTSVPNFQGQLETILRQLYIFRECIIHVCIHMLTEYAKV